MPEKGPNGDVIITTVDLWEKLEEIDKSFGTRLANLEKFRWMAVGGGTVIGALVGTFGGYLVNYVLHK